ncbi:protein fam91a1 [Holotrichia oblita]|uniref:Protein fam91a1 n=1 Tax=Holotrichia oblita TaxID=644536 RepID=A0ACB9SW77_HOLOL|nr:protein fam91a1 [Holotrichia oblita]
MIVKGLRITPFNYYVSVVEKLMQAEKSYDTLPNFTAADSNVRGLLPAVPYGVHIEPWWRVNRMVLEDDIKMVNEEELKIIDYLIDFGSQTAGDLNYYIVLGLYKKGLIYVDVPITAVDRVPSSTVARFRHESNFRLAHVLDVETELVKQAVSLYCRLRFVNKLEAETEQSRMRRHPTWNHQPSPISK